MTIMEGTCEANLGTQTLLNMMLEYPNTMHAFSLHTQT
jgi:hypothetical protein